MKKIIIFTLLVLSFSSSAFAAYVALVTHTPTTTAGASIKGGTTQDLAIAAPSPLIKCSTGVTAMVNFAEDGTIPGTSAGYVIATRHTSGSKYFATTNERVNIYWKQATKVDATNKVGVLFPNEVGAGSETTFEFANGWTSY